MTCLTKCNIVSKSFIVGGLVDHYGYRNNFDNGITSEYNTDRFTKERKIE